MLTTVLCGSSDAGLLLGTEHRDTGFSRGEACASVADDTGVIVHSFNLNISPKMSGDALECHVVMLQNDMLMLLK